jgi:hypothetical protein
VELHPDSYTPKNPSIKATGKKPINNSTFPKPNPNTLKCHLFPCCMLATTTVIRKISGRWNILHPKIVIGTRGTPPEHCRGSHQEAFQEVAGVLNLPQEGIEKARYRLQKKSGLENNNSLQDFLNRMSFS